MELQEIIEMGEGLGLFGLGRSLDKFCIITWLIQACTFTVFGLASALHSCEPLYLAM